MSKIIINCLDHIGKQMAGPAIRAWEIAGIISSSHEVVVLSSNKPKLNNRNFKIYQYSSKELTKQLKDADLLITQKITLKMAVLAKKYKVKVILDAYDPITIEALEQKRTDKINDRIEVNKILLLEQGLSFYFADSVICASEKQRDLWLGVLSSMNRLTPAEYDRDNSLRKLIDIVPFGLSKEPPQKGSTDMLKKKFGILDSDFTLIWGGGIWNWFDPLSLIKAVKAVSSNIPVKLVFMGVDHPNEKIPRMEMVNKAIELSKDLGLYNKIVFFNLGWVDYQDRSNYLMNADVGVSTHYDHLETRFSFRTRILDYMWAELPIIATRGDSFAGLIEESSIGQVVDYSNIDSIEKAIINLYKNKQFYLDCKKNIHNVKKQFYWERCIEPLENMISYWRDHNSTNKIPPKLFVPLLISIYSSNMTILKKSLKKIFRLKTKY